MTGAVTKTVFTLDHIKDGMISIAIKMQLLSVNTLSEELLTF